MLKKIRVGRSEKVVFFWNFFLHGENFRDIFFVNKNGVDRVFMPLDHQ